MNPMFTPPIHPSQIPPAPREVYDVMGEENITRMIEDFYRELEQSAVRDLFPQDMGVSAQKSAAFFVGLLGGPPRYQERYGNPMMRARHLPFPINQAARDEWLACFNRVLDHAAELYNFPPEYLDQFRGFLAGFSLWMMNKE